jgi:hypothetical protein
MARRMVTGVMEPQHFSGQGQGTAVIGIHDQEFFLNTKSTHVTSVDDESAGEGRPAGFCSRPPHCGFRSTGVSQASSVTSDVSDVLELQVLAGMILDGSVL